MHRFPAFCLMLLLVCGITPVRAQVVLRLATLAPDGSIWMQTLNDAKKEVEEATGGAVRMRIYPGGIMGSEKDVLFKIRTGQLQGGGFMGYAISTICPDAAALMFPMALRNYEEVDLVMESVRDILDGNSRVNGFEAMGWTEVGFSYAYSTRPVATLADLKATKVWGLDEPTLQELFAAGSIASIPANVTDVLPALQTGALETVFGPPTAAVAVQWHTRAKYYNEMRLTYSIGGVFISAAAWKQIPEAYQETVRSIIDKHCRLLTPKVRKSDLEALDFMRSQGLQMVAETPEARADFDRIAGNALEKVKGKSFSEAAWNQLQATVQAYRNP